MSLVIDCGDLEFSDEKSLETMAASLPKSNDDWVALVIMLLQLFLKLYGPTKLDEVLRRRRLRRYKKINDKFPSDVSKWEEASSSDGL